MFVHVIKQIQIKYYLIISFINFELHESLPTLQTSKRLTCDNYVWEDQEKNK